MMCTPEKDFALLYFENKAALPMLSGFKPVSSYTYQWFDPRNGKWQERISIKSDERGVINPPPFPDGRNPSVTDWAAKIIFQS
jgi:hypothetical protein